MMKRNRWISVLAAGVVMLSGMLYVRPAEARPAASLTAVAADYASDTLTNYAYEVAAIVNRERAAYGLAPLKFSDQLSDAALVRAQEIQSSFSHTRPDGRSCFTAMTDAGITYSYAGENIAYGQRTPAEVMNGWMNSEGHRANILSSKVAYIGIGVAQRNGVYYWTQFFAASNMLTGSVVTSDTPAQTTAPTVTTAPAASTTRRTTVTTTAAPAATSATPPTVTSTDTTAPQQTTAVPAWTLPNGCGGLSAETLKEALQKLSNILGFDLQALIK